MGDGCSCPLPLRKETRLSEMGVLAFRLAKAAMFVG